MRIYSRRTAIRDDRGAIMRIYSHYRSSVELAHGLVSQVQKKANLTATERPLLNAREFADLTQWFKRAQTTLRNNPTVALLVPNEAMPPDERRTVAHIKRKRACTSLKRPFNVLVRDHLPPLMCDNDALVCRLAFGWYLGAFPRIDMTRDRGIAKETTEKKCESLEKLTRKSKMSKVEREDAAAILLCLNRDTGDLITVS